MIYVIGPEESSVVKIGHTTNKPSQRIGQLQTGNPEALVVRWAGDGDEPIEKHLHVVFGDYRVRGEWFDLSSFEDPVQAVKDEVRKAFDLLARGEKLFAGERYRARFPRRDLTAFDDISAEVVWDPEVPPEMRRGRAVFIPLQSPHQSWDERFPPLRKAVVSEGTIVPRPVKGEDPQPGCIRLWRGRCRRPVGTTCGC